MTTTVVTIFYVIIAILLVLLGVWREHLLHGQIVEKQDELKAKQNTINEQQAEMRRLIFKIGDLQAKRHDTISHDIGRVKTLIEAMKRESVISDKTAKTMIESLERRVTSQSSVVDVIKPPADEKRKR